MAIPPFVPLDEFTEENPIDNKSSRVYIKSPPIVGPAGPAGPPGPVGPTGPAGTFNGSARINGPTITLTGGLGQMITPIANPALLSVNPISGETTTNDEHEFLLSLNYISSHGQSAGVPLSKNKVALYSAIEARPGSGNVWAFNPLLLITAGACTQGGAQIAEYDLANNSGVHFGDTTGVAGLVQPAVFGEQITGISSHRATAAIAILGTLADFTSPMWNRGIAFGGNSIAQVSIADYAQATVSYDVRGIHAYGIDFLNGTCSAGVMRLANQQTIVGRNSAGSADMILLQTSVSNDLRLGAATTPYLMSVAGIGFVPSSDNAQVCGINGARWSSVWSANGAIQTSDPALKRDIRTLKTVDTGSILDNVAPISFRWINGGSTLVEVEEETEVQTTELREWEETVVQMRDGKPTQTVIKASEQVLVFDTLPVVKEDNTQAFEEIPASEATYDAAGRLIRPARAAVSVPMTHRVPRMEKRRIKTTKLRSNTGKRVHWGFSATDVENISAIAGRDFGGFVIAEDGTLSMRPDQMIPILWEELRRLRQRVLKLEAKSLIPPIKKTARKT